MKRRIGALLIGVLALMVGCGDEDNPTPPVVQDECLTDEAAPADEFLYVANAGSNSVSVIDPRLCKAVKTIAVGTGPGELNPTLDGRYVFCMNSDGNNVSVIDTQTNEVVRTITTGASPLHSFWSPDHAKLWIRNDDGASVTVIDRATFGAQTILTGAGHGKMAITDGSPYFVYVSNINDNSVTVINGFTQTVVTTIPVGDGPHGMDYSHVTKHVYNCSGGGTVPAGIDVIATVGDSANTVVRRILTPSGRTNYLHVTEDGLFAWATSPETDQVVVVNLQTEEVLTATTGDYPDKIAFVEGDIAVVSSVLSTDVALINMNTLQRIALVDVAGHGFYHQQFMFGHRWLKESLDGRHVYVPNSQEGTVSIIDITTRARRSTITIGMAPNGIAVAGPTGGLPYPR